MRPPIGLGDFVRARAQLVPLGDGAEAIAELLGVRATAMTVRAVAVVTAPATPVVPSAHPPRVPEVETVERGPRIDAVTETPHRRRAEPIVVEPDTAPAAASSPSWLAAASLDAAPSAIATPWPLEPLIPPLRARALVGAAIATDAADGELSVPRLVDAIATRRPTARLPRELRRTLRRGALLLVDRAPSMEPFYQDEDDLAARILRVAGDVSSRRHFAGDPRTTWIDDAFDERPLELPPPGQPLVALTDLGIRTMTGRRAPAWRALASDLAARGSTLVAFVPYPPSRWPRDLPGAKLIHWDRALRTIPGRAR